MPRGGHFDKRKNPPSYDAKAIYASGAVRVQQQWAHGLKKPGSKTRVGKQINKIRRVRNPDIKVNGYLATEALYLPEFLDSNGDPYPLFKQAPIATYSILRITSAAMDFFNFYDGGTYPNYDDPKYEGILLYNTALSGERGSAFKETVERETYSGDYSRGAANIKGYSGPNAVITMDADIGLNIASSRISSQFNNLADFGFNGQIIAEVVRSLENQYAIYYDALEKRSDISQNFENLSLPPFVPVYPTFKVDGVEYDALDYRLHINTLVKSCFLIFKFTLGKQSLEQYARNSQKTGFSFNRTPIVWMWDENEAIAMKRIVEHCSRVLKKTHQDSVQSGSKNPFPLLKQFDLNASPNSPFMTRAISRMRAEAAPQNIEIWGDYNPNVPVSERAEAIADNTNNHITLKDLCKFFVYLRNNTPIKNALFGQVPQRDLQRDQRGKTIISSIVQFYENTYELFTDTITIDELNEYTYDTIKETIEGVDTNSFRFSSGETKSGWTFQYEDVHEGLLEESSLESDITRALNKIREPDTSEEGRIDSLRGVESAVDVFLQDLALQYALTEVFKTLNPKSQLWNKTNIQNNWGLVVSYATSSDFGIDYLKFLNILGYTDRYFGIRLYLLPPKNQEDGLQTLCSAYERALLDPSERLKYVKGKKRTRMTSQQRTSALVRLREMLPTLVTTFKGIRLFHDRVLFYILCLYAKNENIVNSSDKDWKKKYRSYERITGKDQKKGQLGLPPNVDYATMNKQSLITPRSIREPFDIAKDRDVFYYRPKDVHKSPSTEFDIFQGIEVKEGKESEIYRVEGDIFTPIQYDFSLSDVFGEIFFATTKEQVDYFEYELKKLDDSAIGQCTYDRLITYVNANEQKTMLDLIAFCTGNKYQVNETRLNEIKTVIEEYLTEYSEDNDLKYQIYTLLHAFSKVAGDLKVIPSAWLSDNKLLGRNVAFLDQSGSYDTKEMRRVLRLRLGSYVIPLKLTLKAGSLSDNRTLINSLVEKVQERFEFLKKKLVINLAEFISRINYAEYGGPALWYEVEGLSYMSEAEFEQAFKSKSFKLPGEFTYDTSSKRMVYKCDKINGKLKSAFYKLYMALRSRMTPYLLNRPRFAGFTLLEYKLEDLLVELPRPGLLRTKKMIPKGEAFEGAFRVIQKTHLEWYNTLEESEKMRVFYTCYLEAVNTFIKEFSDHIKSNYKFALRVLKEQSEEKAEKVNDLMYNLNETTEADPNNKDLPVLPCAVKVKQQIVRDGKIIPS